MSSRRPWLIASRASSRKLIREVATRDPNGITRPTRESAAARIRERGGGDLVLGVEVDDAARAVASDLHRAEHAAQGRIERVLGGLSSIAW